jgi:cytochrome c biogenesis protein CcmG/thiol:disulfide interchange protein DsbE
MADRKRLSPLMLLPPLIFAALAILFFFGVVRDDPAALPSTLIGRAAPGLQLERIGDLPLLGDEMVTAPGVKLVNYWGTWCVACRQEHPQLLTMASEMGITLYGVNYDDTPDRALQYLAREGNPFKAVGEDVSGRNRIDWGVYGAPETFVVDGNGRVVLRHAGPITEDILATKIMPAIESAAK